MQKIEKNRSFLIILFAAIFFASIVFLCSCGGKPAAPEREIIPDNVSEVVVMYGNTEIKDHITFEVTKKSDGTIEVFIDGQDLGENAFDWQQLSAYYKLEGNEEEYEITNLMAHLRVYYVDGENETLVQDLPTENRAGKYKVVVSYKKEIEFTVLVKKQSAIQDLHLYFNEENKIAEDSYEFVFGEMRKSDYRAMIGEEYSLNYGYGVISVEEYKQNVGVQDVDLADVDISELGYGAVTPAFDELGVGEWFVAAYIEEAGFDMVWSNICYLRITQSEQGFSANIQSFSYTFPVLEEYAVSNITLNSIIENDVNSIKIFVDNKAQTMSEGFLGLNGGVWELASKQDLENFVATDGTEVLEENIVSNEESLIAGTNKYVALKFDFNNENFLDRFFLVNLKLLKGEVMLPDEFWLGNATDTTDLVEITTYCGISCELKCSYANNMDWYATYYDESGSNESTTNGTKIFTLKNSDKYKFASSSILASKVQESSNFESATYSEDNSVVNIVWKLDPLIINPTFSYEITETQHIEAGDVVSGDANVFIILNITNLSGHNFSDFENLFSYELNGTELDANEISFNGNVATTTVSVDGFVNNIYVASFNLLVKENYLGKVKLFVSNSESADAKESDVNIEQFEITNQQISTERITGAVTVNSIQNLPYIKKLNNYYSVVWKEDGNVIDSNTYLGGRVLTLTLTPINTFFVKPFDAENYYYSMAYDEGQNSLEFFVELITKTIFVNYGDATVVQKDGNNIVQKVSVLISFDSLYADSVVFGKDEHDNDIYIVSVELEDETFASIESVEKNDEMSLLVTLLITGFNGEDIAEFYIVLEVLGDYVLDINSQGYEIEKFDI